MPVGARHAPNENLAVSFAHGWRNFFTFQPGLSFRVRRVSERECIRVWCRLSKRKRESFRWGRYTTRESRTPPSANSYSNAVGRPKDMSLWTQPSGSRPASSATSRWPFIIWSTHVGVVPGSHAGSSTVSHSVSLWVLPIEVLPPERLVGGP